MKNVILNLKVYFFMLSHVMSITKREKNKQFIISFVFFPEELAFALT